MNYWITINEDDDALKSDRDHELERILKDAANRIARGHEDFALLDINGNTVGHVTKCDSWHGAAEAEGYTGCTGWNIEDVKGHYPELTDDEAGDYLLTHADNICDLMVSRGNDYLADVSPDEDE